MTDEQQSDEYGVGDRVRVADWERLGSKNVFGTVMAIDDDFFVGSFKYVVKMDFNGADVHYAASQLALVSEAVSR